MAAEGAVGAAQQSWPGLPRGAQFNPSDSDLLWHLAAEVGNGLASRHPFINEFIKSVDENRVFGCTHPQDIPGVRQDGRASYFFHKKFKFYNNENDKYISWQKSGTPRSIILDGSLRGCKEVFVLYAYKTNDNSPQRTDWRLHQYHIKNAMKGEEELVVSKIFYNSQKNRCEWDGKAPAQSAQDASVSDNNSKELIQLEIHSANIATESNFAEGNVNNQEQVQMETYPDQNKLSSCKDVLDTTHINHENQINDHAETELDNVSLEERYIILLAGKHSCSARVSVEKCVMNDSANSCRQMGAETSGSSPKSETEEINHEGTTYREDIRSMLQEISSAPPTVDSTGDDSNMMLLGKVPPGTQISPLECFVDSNDYRAELLSSPTPTCGNENIQLAVRNPETFLVDVKLEPALEGYEIYPSESPQVKSHHSSKHGSLENTGSVPGCLSKDSETDFELLHGMGDLAEKISADCACSNQSTDPKHVKGCSLVGSKNSVSSDICKIISAAASSQANSTHAEGPLPSLGVKSELTGSELPGLCEYIAEPIVKTTHTRTLNHDGGLAYCSRQTKKRKMAMNSSEKAFEEDSYRIDEGIAYCSRRRRKKTATDSIEKALEEDAPGLLQILLDKGIMVKEIKLYGVEEDDEMLLDCTESDFQDLENVITKLFPHRASLLKSAARHAKGEKAMYCLACLISLIDQSRYLQFRDCPVEWGWCRDLQSFVFVFRSHNRIVLERPEYGYATYFFEIVQSLPIEWQIRRLVTAMKLSSCGRTALIENRPLLVGEDLTEGEAQVLEEYGWIPNTGLGTMLNYRDRVVHDRWNEKYSTDWRMKIGKLLMAGYSEGQLITTHIPTKVGKLSEDTEVKLEDPF